MQLKESDDCATWITDDKSSYRQVIARLQVKSKWAEVCVAVVPVFLFYYL